MNATGVIQHALQSTKDILNWYLSDLSDADLLVRPAPAANHIAWQLGHLVQAESYLLAKNLPSATYPDLPAGWAERHSKEASKSDTGFGTKAEYLDLFNKMRTTTITAVAALTEADLDKPTIGDIAKFAPTLGALLVLTANHTMMHAGQFTVVRRKLGKPVLF